VLVDKHPFGANGELRDGLERLRDHGGRSVLGLRDILDDPETVAAEWRPHGLPDRIADFYDRVLVYGQREVFDSVAAYGFPTALAARTAYCGYVSASDAAPEPAFQFPASVSDRLGSSTDARAVVLATVGGGEDGFQLLRAFLEGAADAPWQSVAVTGPLICNGELKELSRLAQQAGARLHRFVPRLEEWFGTASAVVCMGGYNTVTQGLQSGASLVCVPRTQPRREQWIRAEEFSRLGLLQTVHPEHLHADSLRDAVIRALQISRPQLQQHIQRHLRFDGAAVAAQHLLALARARRGMRRPSHRNPALAPA
jgi:predicted glycosyltransferase